MKLISASRIIPHPEKAATGGEDACFIGSDGRTTGVADGVGGWTTVKGADPAKYSRDMMRFADELAHLNDPRMIIDAAIKKLDLTVPGSTTTVVAKVDKDILKVCSLGDSGIAVIRDGRLIFRSMFSVYGFNFPLQIGSRGGVTANMGTYEEVGIVPNDILVLGTDGLWDNVWEKDIEAMAGKTKDVKSIADALAETASANGGKSDFASPFAAEAQSWGKMYMGGKLDDVTVVACRVEND